MTLDELEYIHGLRPIRPIVLHLADHREIRVPSPEYMALKESKRIVRIYSDDDSFESVDLMLIVSASVSAPSTSR